jgi:diguanylate cyclase (GGDEF)-like protein/PAS domain S-box-containing protein
VPQVPGFTATPEPSIDVPGAGPGGVSVRWSQVFAVLGEAVIVTDPVGHVMEMNPAAEALFGCRRAECTGRPISDVIQLEHADRLAAEIPEALVRDGCWSGETRVPDGQDGWRDIATTITVVTDEVGHPLATVSVHRDVTDAHRAAELLAESEQRWRLTLDGAPSGIALVDLDGRFLRVNGELCRLVGFAEEELLTLRFHDITHPEDLDEDVALVRQVLAGDIDSYMLDKRYVHADGSIVWVRLTVALIADPSTGAPRHFVAQMEDIGDQVAADEAVRAAVDRQARLVAAQLAIASVELTPTKVMQAIAEHARHLTDAAGAALALREGEKLVYRAVAGSLNPFLGLTLPFEGSLSGRALVQGRSQLCHDASTDPRVDQQATSRTGTRAMLVVPVRHADTTIGVLAVSSSVPGRFDDTDRSALELLAAPFGTVMSNAWNLQVTSHQAQTDVLTGLHNRTYALHELERALARQGRQGGHTAVLFIDLDRFKPVNDTLGHHAGDRLLVGVADQLRALVRTTDTAARYGGDEFVIICEGLVHPDDAAILAERLLAALPGPYAIDGHRVELGASIGVAVAEEPVPAEQLLGAADAAMYAAKHAGGDRYSTRVLPE